MHDIPCLGKTTTPCCISSYPMTNDCQDSLLADFDEANTKTKTLTQFPKL